jgi:hypothetical protein
MLQSPKYNYRNYVVYAKVATVGKTGLTGFKGFSRGASDALLHLSMWNTNTIQYRDGISLYIR